MGLQEAFEWPENSDLGVSSGGVPYVRNRLEANLDFCGKSGQMVSEVGVINTDRGTSVEPQKQKK